MNIRLSPLSTNGTLLVLICICSFQLTHAIRFDLQPSGKKCLKEEMRKNLLAVGEYQISSGVTGSYISFQVTDSKGHSALIRDNIEGNGKFAIISDEDDIYDFCFTYSSSPHQTGQLPPREVNLDVRLGVEAKQYDDSSNDKLHKLQNDLNKVEDLSNSIIEDFAHLKRREAEMQDTNESTSSRIFYQTIFSIIVLIGLTTWQVLHLRKFFRRRRLID